MCDSVSDIVHQSTSYMAHDYPIFDPDLFPEITALFQNSQSSSNCLCRTDLRMVPHPSDSRASIGTIPYNSRVQDVTFQRRASTMDQRPFPEPSATNELTVLSWSEIREDNLVTKHHFMVPTIPHIELPGTEALRDRSGIPSLAIPIASEGLEDSSSESPSQAGSISPSEQCYTLWKQIPVDAIVVTGPNKFVPQRLYRPFTEADEERYLERISLSAPIIFVTKEPFEWGISLEDVRNGKMRRLVDKEVAVLQDCGPSVSIRINWPGYASFKRQFSSRNWRKTKGPITKEKLAQNLAKTTCRFIEKMSNKPLEVGAEKSWKVGPQYIKVEDLILVSLHQVSKGSWQPQFRLRRDFVT